ncbi:MAG: saccharopine dehydrogenase NADP-binding domain-containing protein [Noviherbaspirillum sp.]
MDSRYRVLIIGGYGTFGQRIARALSKDAGFELLIGGRTLEKARALCDTLFQRAISRPLFIDIDDQQVFSATLTREKPALVIHTSGPFQRQDYGVAQACIAAGIHYIDLADAREFVCRFSELNPLALRHDALAVTGASSVPGLSAAVVDHFLPEFSRLDNIDFGINPGNQTPRGVASVSSILSYCGKPFMRWEQGAWKKAFGWQTLQAVRYPEPVGLRWFANCDIPDLRLFPQRYPGVRSVIFRAGLELPILHLGTWMMSWLSRYGLVRNWADYASGLKKASECFLRYGSTRGGMHVALKGLDHSGRQHERKWHILADDGDGPQIPCTAAVVLAKKLARRQIAIRGAMPCVGLFSLQEFMDELTDYSIRSIAS